MPYPYTDDENQLAPEIILGARQLPNPQGIAPRMDTEGPPPTQFSGGAKLSAIPPAKMADQGDVSNPPAADVKPEMMREASAMTPAGPPGGGSGGSLPTLFPEHSNTAEHRMNEIPAPMGPNEGQSAHAAKMRVFGDAKEHLNSQLLKSPDEFQNPLDYTKHLEGVRQGLGAIKEAQAEYEMSHPWGSMESSHPGVFGKIGHAFGEIGNVAGEAFAPGLAEAIPGSHANLEQQQAQGAGQIKEAVGEQGVAAGIGAKDATAEKNLAQAAVQPSIEARNEAQAGLADKKTDVAEPNVKSQAIHDLMTGNEGGGPQTNPLTGKPYTYAEAYGAVQGLGKTAGKEGKQQHVSGTLNGSPAFANFDTAKGEYTDPETHQPLHGFKPAPNYAQVLPNKLETQTKELAGPDGISHQYGWDPKTSRYDIDMGVAGTGQQGSRLFASGVSRAAGETLIHDIQTNREKLGTLEAWVKKNGIDTPIGDPVLARLQSEMASFAALQPAQHGFRSASAMEAFEKIIGGLQKNPDATIESIRGINEITGQSLPKSAPGQTAPPAAPQTGGSSIPSFKDWKNKK